MSPITHYRKRTRDHAVPFLGIKLANWIACGQCITRMNRSFVHQKSGKRHKQNFHFINISIRGWLTWPWITNLSRIVHRLDNEWCLGRSKIWSLLYAMNSQFPLEANMKSIRLLLLASSTKMKFDSIPFNFPFKLSCFARVSFGIKIFPTVNFLTAIALCLEINNKQSLEALLETILS